MDKTIYELFPECEVKGLEHSFITDEAYPVDKGYIIVSDKRNPPLLYGEYCGVKIFHLYATNQKKRLSQHVYIGETPCVFVSIYAEGDGTMKNARKLAKANLAFITSGYTLYRKFYGMDDEVYTRFVYGYSQRSKAYLDKVKHELGIISWSDVPNSFIGDVDSVFTDNLEDVYHWPPLVNTSSVEVGRIEDQWIAQFDHRIAVVDWAITKVRFNRRPTQEILLKSINMLEAERYLEIHRVSPHEKSALSRRGKEEQKGPTVWDRCDYNEYYICRDCGRLTHWTEATGDISEKWERLQEKSCGCMW